ncbi:MAG: hypothetical protein J0M12_04255 [Deltaproteobacteria bacterium]|nr:hypothetical protein [Deltaproteobacteria bacterium]
MYPGPQRRVLLFFILSLPFLCALGSAYAESHITSFEAEVRLRKDATVIITETVQVDLAPQPASVGIIFSIPKRTLGVNRKVRSGNVLVNYVFRDGQKEEFRIESTPEAFLVHTGGKNAVTPGLRTYTIQFERPHVIDRGVEYDGFSIALPGKWSWAVDQTSLSFRFPEFLDPKTAVLRATVSSYSSTAVSEKTLPLSVTEERITIDYPTRLSAGETLWIEVKLPKGFIHFPS